MADSRTDHHEKVGVVATNSLDYVRIMLGHLQDGRISVPLRSDKDDQRITRSGVGDVLLPGSDTGWLKIPFTSKGGATPAMVSFTSGTEGEPKAVFLSHDNLHDVVQRLTDVMKITSDIREYIGVPVFHSFGYARCRAVLNAGGAVYIPPKDFDLTEIREMLKAREINAISAVPSLWRIFLQNLDRFGDELMHVKWVEIGSQFMTAAEKIALRTALPNAQIVQHYGLTEASRSTFLSIHETPENKLASVGRADGPIGIRLNQENCIEIKGGNVALAIDDGTERRTLGPETWLTTSDLGRIVDGYLYFDGRADDMINCSGVKMMPDLIEEYLRKTVPGASDFAVTRWPDAMRGDRIMLAIGPKAHEKEATLERAIKAYGSTLGLELGGAVSVRNVEALPVTATGKLQRKELIKALEAVAGDTSIPNLAEAANINEFLIALFGADAVETGESFDQTGADSLNHMQMSILLEGALGRAPDNWEAMPLRDLQGMIEAVGDFDISNATITEAPPLPDGSRDCNPKDISFWGLVREDYRTNDASVFHQGFLMLFIHRFGNWRMNVRPKLLRAPLTVLYRLLNKQTQLFFGMKLDYTVKVGRRVKLEHFGGMILGAREIGNDVYIRQNTTFGIRSTRDIKAKPIIGDHVDIGAGAVIVGDIKVGENSVIGANSVVYSNVPPNSVVIGVPAKLIGQNPRQNPSPLAD